MVKAVFVVMAFVIGAVIVYHAVSHSLPMQGMVRLEGAEPVLISRARPQVFFRPATDMVLLDAGWKSVRPDDRRLDTESVRLSFAVYANTKGLLVTALAESPGDWEWIPAHHVPYPALRTVDEPYDKEHIYESIFVLKPSQDPFYTAFAEAFPSKAKDTTPILVYRGKFLLFGRSMQVIFEYHESIDAEMAKTMDLRSDYMRDFAARGRAACTVAFPIKAAMEGLKSRMSRLRPAKEGYERATLSTWLGEIKHPGSGR